MSRPLFFYVGIGIILAGVVLTFLRVRRGGPRSATENVTFTALMLLGVASVFYRAFS